MNSMARAALGAAAALLILGSAAGAKEVELTAAQVPPAVLDSLNVHFPAAKFLGFSGETEKGSTLYEAEMTVEGRRVDALLDSLGVVKEVETEIAVKELPAAVRTGLARTEYAKAKIEKAERHLRPGAEVAPTYELQVEWKGAHHELVFDAGGTLIRGESSGEADEPDEKD